MKNSMGMVSRDEVVNVILAGELVMAETANEFAFIGVVLKGRGIPYHVVRVSRTQIAFHFGSQACIGWCE